ncbi:MAG: right-handed parallel beta-helix repeat-containing protein [Fimbriimonadaceae bacterium]
MAVSGVLLAPSAMAETVTVTTLEDASDFSGSKQVSDLPGPDGLVSFREAVTAANNTAGPQTIAFAIPTSEFWLITDMALLRLEQGAFSLNDSGTTLDFTTQTANIGNTNPDGMEVGFYGLEANAWGVAAIFINADNCVIKGLGNVYQRGYAVQILGHNNRVIGCQIAGPLYAAVSVASFMGWAPPTGNIVGGTTPGEANILEGVRIGGPAEDNVVIGNIITNGVIVQGATRYGVFARNNRIGGPTAAERNVISGAGYYGEEGFPVGNQVTIVDADDTIVEGNYIGTTIDGMSRFPQQIGPTGIEVRDARGTTIRNNLIAGMRVVGTNHYAGQIFGQAVYVSAANDHTYDTVIHDNTIGLAADGVTPIITRTGIRVSPLTASYHAVGTVIRSNHIAKVETNGITVGSQENGITITQNSIHDCGGLGIDLYYGYFEGTGGVTLNDPGDGDEGGNGLQNFPVLLSAETSGTSITMDGTLDTYPSEEFTIEFFASQSGDPSGFGEGAVFLGSTSVTTDGAGHVAFSLTLPANVPVGQVATATATRVSTGDTSEFSAWIDVASGDLLVAPDSFSVIWGILMSGSLESLVASDDVRTNIAGSVTGHRGAPNAQVELSGTSPLSQPAQLTLKLEAQTDLFPLGQVSQRIEMFDFVAQQWVQVDQRFATITDSVASYSVTSNAGRFVEPGTRRIHARLTWFGGSQISRTQGPKIDQFCWWVR